ncbi:UNVERIFIED_CONTAM: Transposon Tf2-11 polyprotein [Sesamum radiatum]|uniref:Transposon Tf2-11 polyprotein n=1 Tax=Sesamum radiatum TaxID=300843 RepID=A0AAW2V4F7_SESRA
MVLKKTFKTYHITLIEDGEVEEEDAKDAPAELEEDVFAWSYKEMPGLDPKVAVHHLSVKKGTRPVKQGLHRFRPELIPLIEGEVKKLIEVGFIREVKYPMWISSIVPVRKKNGQIRVCVDFRDLNNACPKDDFPLPIVELMIDATMGHEALSFTDGSSGYNKICMAPPDEELMAFRTPKGIYCYKVMLFGLKNVDATYQRADGMAGDVELEHLLGKDNKQADALTKLASTVLMTDKETRIPICKSWVIPPIFSDDEDDMFQEEENYVMEVFEVEEEDWRQLLVHYLKYGKLPNDLRRRTDTRRRATCFIYYKVTLYRRSF